MTVTPAAEQTHTRGHAVARHPVRVAIDGDFAIDDLLALPADGPARRLHSVPTTLDTLEHLRATDAPDTSADTHCDPARTPSNPTGADAVLLRRFEVSGLFQPPVREQITGLSPEAGAAWLALAARWVDLSQSSGDLRFLNTACKLIGAVWAHHTPSGDRQWNEPGLTAQLAAVGRVLGEATDRLQRRLTTRSMPSSPAGADEEDLKPDRLVTTSQARIVVLAGAGSRSAGRLVSAATTAGLPIETVCWYAPPRSPLTEPSNYSSAWYPPGQSHPSPSVDMPRRVQATTARTWEEVAAAIHSAGADIVLLVGMPVVPDFVLHTAPSGVLNAHNGALPTYRGMDAVGWALLHDEPVVCSLHMARPEVDAGELIATHAVPIVPLATLAARVKTTQLQLLLDGAAHVAATGALPDLTPQPTNGTQFYRLHPHLKRLLDASPYALNDGP
ncbi:formyltransferase family protein [Amycolatopsis sp. lyj-108]|uniref:formyltransferase family protein n=1 Tax=Amycolatopsis sp. lyj-108 TaxID=2789286 RepID=UPI00397D0478